MCGQREFWWLIKSSIKSSFFFASAWHHCLNESREWKFRALTIPWRHHTQDGMHYKTCLFLFSPQCPKTFQYCSSSFPGELVECSCWGMHVQWKRTSLKSVSALCFHWLNRQMPTLFWGVMPNTWTSTMWMMPSALWAYVRLRFVEKQVKVIAHIFVNTTEVHRWCMSHKTGSSIDVLISNI